MAGSRLERIGTVFSRTTGLLKTGAIKYQDRPVWYDVHQIFPPKYEPQFDRTPEIEGEVPSIMYKEDKYRAKYFASYGLNPGGELRNLSDPGFQESSQRFIKKCFEVENRDPNYSLEEVFDIASQEVKLYSPVRKVSTSVADDSGEISTSTVAEKRSLKKSLVTVDSLLKLFKEAKEEEKNEKT